MQRIRLKVPLAEDALVRADADRPATAPRASWSARCTKCTACASTATHDLRPILLYEGFEGHPLRKDYPMEQEQPIVPYRK